MVMGNWGARVRVSVVVRLLRNWLEEITYDLTPTNSLRASGNRRSPEKSGK